MDVFVIPIGRDRYELYCEMAGEPDGAELGPPPTGVIREIAAPLFRDAAGSRGAPAPGQHDLDSS